MLDRIRELLRGPQPPTSENVREALSLAREQATEASEELARLSRTRADLLLDGTDQELDRLERDADLAKRRHEQAGAAISALETRLREVEVAEELGRKAELVQEGLDLVDEYGEHLDSVATLHSALVSHYDRLKEIDSRVANILEETRGHPDRGRLNAPNLAHRGQRPPLWSEALIPAVFENGETWRPADQSSAPPYRVRPAAPAEEPSPVRIVTADGTEVGGAIPDGYEDPAAQPRSKIRWTISSSS